MNDGLLMRMNLDPFTPLLGADFKVKGRFDFWSAELPSAVRERFKTLEARGLTYIDKKGVRQLFEPAYFWTDEGVEGPLSGRASHVLIPGDSRANADEIRLVFRRKTSTKTGMPRLWMLAARHGEPECFTALSTLNTVDYDLNYITLTYRCVETDISSFEPMYLKVLYREEYAYLAIEARDSGRDILVTCQNVLERQAPKTLWRERDYFGT